MTTLSHNNQRNSNIELFRIIVMLLIVAHHYVVSSGVIDIVKENFSYSRSIFFFLLGAWGKTGINCFVLITGYFMCKSSISIRKYAKLYLEIKFYYYVLFFILLANGFATFSLRDFFINLLPFNTISIAV